MYCNANVANSFSITMLVTDRVFSHKAAVRSSISNYTNSDYLHSMIEYVLGYWDRTKVDTWNDYWSVIECNLQWLLLKTKKYEQINRAFSTALWTTVAIISGYKLQTNNEISVNRNRKSLRYVCFWSTTHFTEDKSILFLGAQFRLYRFYYL